MTSEFARLERDVLRLPGCESVNSMLLNRSVNRIRDAEAAIKRAKENLRLAVQEEREKWFGSRG